MNTTIETKLEEITKEVESTLDSTEIDIARTLDKCIDVINLSNQIDPQCLEYSLIPRFKLEALKNFFTILDSKQGDDFLSKSSTFRKTLSSKISEFMTAMDNPPFSNLRDVIEMHGLLYQTYVRIVLIEENHICSTSL